MIREIDLEIRNEDYELITYKQFIELLSHNHEYIHITNKKDFLYVEVKRMANMYSIGGCGSDLNSKIYNYDHYRVENQ